MYYRGFEAETEKVPPMHLISCEGVSMRPNKIKDIITWPTPISGIILYTGGLLHTLQLLLRPWGK